MSFKGCTEGPHVDAAAYASTDGFVRAVWVDRDCRGALRFMGDPRSDAGPWCASERGDWRRFNLFLVRGSRRLIGDCRPSQLVGVSGASPECVSYKLVGRRSAGCRNVTSAAAPAAGCAGGHATRYEFEVLDLVVARRHAQWKVVAFFEQTGLECFPGPGCGAIMRDWERRVPLHSRGPL